MKSKKEIEHLAFKTYGDGFLKGGFIHGYTQCQKDMADKKYTKDDMLNCWNTVMVAMTNKNPVFFKDYINSLNKKD